MTDLISLKDAAAMTGYAATTIRNYHSSGRKLPFETVKVGELIMCSRTQCAAHANPGRGRRTAVVNMDRIKAKLSSGQCRITEGEALAILDALK